MANGAKSQVYETLERARAALPDWRSRARPVRCSDGEVIEIPPEPDPRPGSSSTAALRGLGSGALARSRRPDEGAARGTATETPQTAGLAPAFRSAWRVRLAHLGDEAVAQKMAGAL
jgi:hypothetical protein